MVIPEEAAIVKRIFQDFLDGKSRLETERELAADGIRTRNGCRWMDSNIKVILTNITYTGNLLLQKEYIADPVLKKRKKNLGELPQYYVENAHEPIITKETFDYVQQEMARRKKLGPLANKSLNTTCFTGKIKCGICGKSYVHNLRLGRKFEDSWGCASRKRAGQSCGAKGGIPKVVLLRECTKVMGLEKFDEQSFLEQVEKIVVPEHHVMVFYMKDGRRITKHWEATAKKDCWTEEHKNRQRAWLKNYMANGKGTRFYVFTTRIRCALCGASFRRSKSKAKNSQSVYWRCSNGSQCESVSLLEEDLKRVMAEVMGTTSFDEDTFRDKVEYIEAGKQNQLTVHFKNGRIVETSYILSKQHPKRPRKENR